MTIDTGGDFEKERDLDGGFLKADEHWNHCKAWQRWTCWDNDDYDHHDLAMTFLTLSDDDDEYCDDAGDDDNDNYDVLKWILSATMILMHSLATGLLKLHHLDAAHQ